MRFKIRGALSLLFMLSIVVTPTQIAFVQAPEPTQIFVRLNQLGFRPQDHKSAVAFSRSPLPPKFSISNARTSQVVLEGATKPLAGRWGQFDYHVEIDFSSLRQAGRFFIKVGTSQSKHFEIGDSNYAGVSDQLLEFMRQRVIAAIRCNRAMTAMVCA